MGNLLHDLRSLNLDDVLSVLADRVAERITSKASASTQANDGDPLLDRKAMARDLGVAPVTLDRAVKDGCPVCYIGEAPRFDRRAVRAYFAARKPAALNPRPTNDNGGPVRLVKRGGK